MSMSMTEKFIETRFGRARLNDYGYYRISSKKEGNKGKLLHRLIFEEFYNIELPSHVEIHHEDGNKTNNEIWNLVPMTKSEHMYLHQSGENHRLFGKKHSKKTVINMSKAKNTTGIFRVYKSLTNNVYQGFRWNYVCPAGEDGKRKVISSIDIQKLEKKVKAKGLEWIILDEEKAKECGAI